MRIQYQKQVRDQGDNRTAKPKHVLTAHGLVYIAKLIDKLKQCKAENGIGSHCELPSQQCTCIADGERLKAQFADISPQILGELDKVDWLTRILLFVQASWMIIQSSARWWYGLPLTLLELQATAHVGLAIARL